jgi:DNA-binding response OmpR family regulator
MYLDLGDPLHAPNPSPAVAEQPTRSSQILHHGAIALVRHLRALEEYRFEILYADAEESALDLFENGGVAFVIVDYHLRQGDGLHCLEELRRRDPIVPILAISGLATDDEAAALVEAGADDFISKRELTSAMLAPSMREALQRADIWRQRMGDAKPGYWRAGSDSIN